MITVDNLYQWWGTKKIKELKSQQQQVKREMKGLPRESPERRYLELRVQEIQDDIDYWRARRLGVSGRRSAFAG